MAVFVDDLTYYRYPPDGYRSRHNPEAGHYWCHLFADTLKELHAAASVIGLRRQWFQDKRYPHYDLTTYGRQLAVRRGATEIDARDWIRRCHSAKR